MIVTLADFWRYASDAEATTAPPDRPRRAPVLMGDILMARNGDPELLVRWRQDRESGTDES